MKNKKLYIIIAAISRAGKVILPHKNDEIKENDILYALGDKKIISQLHKKIHEEDEQIRLNNVMIIGGGKTGFYLAQKLEEYGSSVKIIEHDLDRCRYLAQTAHSCL